MTDDDITRMDVAEFRELGLLQEVNRRFLHPMGLALEVEVDDDGTERFGGVWDYRDDPEGIAYVGGLLDTEEALERKERVDEMLTDKTEARTETLGYVIQPVWGTSDAVVGTSGMTVDGKRLTWPDAFARMVERFRQAEQLAVLLEDLDRCEHGRHEGNDCSGCGGPSHGNPLSGGPDVPDRTLGYTLAGRLIVYPEPYSNSPAAWQADP